MSIIMRIIQQFEPQHEDEFMSLEKKFHELEMKHPDFPKGKRMQPVSAHEPVNTLIWQHEFADIQTAYRTLDFFKGDSSHEELFRHQVPYMKEVKIEFYKILDFQGKQSES
jgi:hypothetical protein